MGRVLKEIDQLASALAAKLEETRDHKPLDQIIKNLAKYASTPPHLPKGNSLIRDTAYAGHSKKKIRRLRPCMNEDFLSDWFITATMRESSFPHVRQLKMRLIHST